MQSFHDNLQIAQEINEQVKGLTVCSNDIIPRNQLPWLTPAMIPSVKRQFGNNKIDTYMRHTEYMTEVRNLLTSESQSKGMPCATSSTAIAIARLGAGECQELSTLALMKLITRGRRDVAFVAIMGKPNELKETRHPFLHAFILLGIDHTFSLKDGHIRQLNGLSDKVVILDPLLNHVGRAADYLKDQSQYLTIFGHNRVCAVDVVGQLHIDNFPIIEDNVRQLLAYAESKGILPFERTLCDLPLANNPSLKKQRCEETTLLRGLNTRSGLTFSGMADERCRVDAVTEIHSDAQATTAKNIQCQLGAGCFYTGASQRFFVIHDINVAVGAEKNLPRRIHESYC